MEDTQYKQLIQTAPFGFAYHEIVVDANGKPVDYRFLEINDAFKKLTGLKSSDVIGLKISEVLPTIKKSDLDLIELLGDVALNGGIKEFEQYSETMNRWYKVQAYSSEKGYFSTLFTEITPEINQEAKESIALLTQRLSLATRAGRIGIWDYDPVNNRLTWDDQMFALYGIDKGIFGGAYEAWQAGVHPEDKARSSAEVGMALRGEKDFDTEFRVVCPDSAVRNIRAIGVVLRDTEGQPVRMIGTNWDITEKKFLLEKLKSSEENFRTFFETIDDMIMVGNQQGVIIYTNSAVPRKLGYSTQELHTMHVLDIHPESKRKEAEQIFSDMFAGRRDSCPLPLARKDGTFVPVETRVWFGKWDGKDCIFGISKDLSREQGALQKFNKIFEKNPALMAISTIPERIITEVNQAFLKKTGYREEEIIGKTSQELQLFAEPEKQIAIADSLQKTGHVSNFELKVKTKNGTILDGLFSGEIMESQGKRFFLTVMTDITAQKEAELLAIQASKAKSEFLANMSHEIRTPLNGVIGFTDLLGKTTLNKTQQQYVENANTSAHALLGIINDILDFSKIEAGKLELEISKTDIIEVVEQATDIIKYPALQKGLELLLNIHPDIPRYAWVDPMRLRQILVNLLGNAVKFTKIGEVELKIDFTRIDAVSGYFSFLVRDTGIGISEEQQKKLFKAFSQADSSTTRKFGGTGLGLIISSLLAEKMGGKIELCSELGKGSNFSFILKAHYEAGEKPDIGKLRKVRRVLVIDDNDYNRKILEHILRSWGIDYTGCDNGLSALKIIDQSKPFDVLIVDYQMPYLDGLDTIKMIREQWKLTPEKQAIILLYSSAEDAKIHEKCKTFGIQFCLSKPVKSAELFRLLQNIHTLPTQQESAVTVVKVSSDTVVKVSDDTLGRNAGSVQNDPTLTILVAEDVAMNMLLVTTILKEMFPEAILLQAMTGKEALDIVSARKTDLILMDIQMPEMGGIEATERIRVVESAKGGHIPIIALTAGVVKGEEEKCLKAGMDDFLTKPIHQQELLKLVKKYLSPTLRETHTVQDKNINKEDILHFNRQLLIERINNNRDLLQKLIDIAPAQFSSYMESLANAIHEKNRKEIQRIIHSIKGASWNMCFQPLAEFAKEMESKMETNRMEDLDAMLPKMRLEWEHVRSILERSSTRDQTKL